MAALLSLLTNKIGRKKGVVSFTSAELIQMVLKTLKSKRVKNERGRSCS